MCASWMTAVFYSSSKKPNRTTSCFFVFWPWCQSLSFFFPSSTTTLDLFNLISWPSPDCGPVIFQPFFYSLLIDISTVIDTLRARPSFSSIL